MTMFDPDAGRGAGWWHWIMFDIDPRTTSLPSGAGDPISSYAPPGSVSSVNSYGEMGYSGPCPPREDAAHRYVFTVYALRTEKIGLKPGTDPATVLQAIQSEALLSTTLQAQYER